MKILKFSSIDTYDFMVFGLGYESRSISAFTELYSQDEKAIAVGYERHTDALFYEENRKCFSDAGVDVIEGKDSCVLKEVYKRIDLLIDGNLPSNVLLDITVLSRHRLASILDRLITTLPIGSTLTLAYYLSGYVEPPEGTTPIRLVSEITPEFSGAIGDLSLPTSLILGLGYEKEKALGLSNYLEAGNEYIFIPRSSESNFEDAVRRNNSELLRLVPDSNIFTYNVEEPYATYLDLKALTLSVCDYSRPLLVPLGPKMLSAISVILARELYPNLPVWRVSSEHTEIPVERSYSGKKVLLTIQL